MKQGLGREQQHDKEERAEGEDAPCMHAAKGFRINLKHRKRPEQHIHSEGEAERMTQTTEYRRKFELEEDDELFCFLAANGQILVFISIRSTKQIQYHFSSHFKPIGRLSPNGFHPLAPVRPCNWERSLFSTGFRLLALAALYD